MKNAIDLFEGKKGKTKKGVSKSPTNETSSTNSNDPLREKTEVNLLKDQQLTEGDHMIPFQTDVIGNKGFPEGNQKIGDPLPNTTQLGLVDPLPDVIENKNVNPLIAEGEKTSNR